MLYQKVFSNFLGKSFEKSIYEQKVKLSFRVCVTQVSELILKFSFLFWNFWEKIHKVEKTELD